LVLVFLFIVLQNGLLLDEFSVQNVKIKQLYIKWDEKIDLSIKEITLHQKQSATQAKPDLIKIKKYLEYLGTTSHWFHSINIETIHFNDTKASFRYKAKENGHLYVKSPNFSLHCDMYFEGQNLKFDIKKFQEFNKFLTLKGSVLLNPNTLSLDSLLELNIHNDLQAKLFLKFEKNHLSYKLVNQKKITNIKNIVSIIHLPKEVKYWVLDAIEMDYLSIESATGLIDFDHLDDALKNINIKATVHGLNYTYNPKLDAIHTQETKLEFKDGFLYIRPQKAYSYGMYLDKSWLKIDFTQPEELLTLQLLFKGIVNKDMLKILSAYKIDLPFLQRSGKVKTDLTITVGLRNIDVDAHGTFFTKQANFDFIGLNIDIFDALIVLNNYDVVIKKMKTNYKDIASAIVDVKYDAHSAKGTIHFNAKKIATKEIKLLVDKSPVMINYHINPHGDSIDVGKTQWFINNKTLYVDTMHIPFDLQKLTIDLPTTFFEVKKIVSGFLTGTINLKNNEANLLADILHLDYSNVQLLQSNAQVKVHYKDTLSLSIKEMVHLRVADTDMTLANSLVEAKLNKGQIILKHTTLNVEDTLYATLSAKYSNLSNLTLLKVKKLKILNKDTNELLYKKSRLILDINNKKKVLTIGSKKLNSIFQLYKDSWRLELNSLEKISKGSQFLKDLSITNGKLSFYKKMDENSIKFNGDINYKYKILSQYAKPISLYKIKGKINKKKIYFTINKNLASVKIEDKISVKIKNAGINIAPLLQFIDLLKQHSKQKKETPLTLYATNCYLQAQSGNIVLSQEIKLQHVNKVTTAQLTYKDGSAGFKLDNDTFHLYGKNFNDEFMDKLFRLSRFKGGTLDFSMNGKIQDYDGVFYINKATIVDYKLLNNVLAFINTVPSLITFSLPSYSKNGLFVDSAYMQFTAKNGRFDISDFYLDAKEIDIIAKGTADIRKDTIDVTLNLKTDLGSSASKIPIVGYILFDKDSISTTMSITGKLSDPDVSSMLAKDIVVAPLNIIKRTLLYPYELLRSKDNNSSK